MSKYYQFHQNNSGGSFVHSADSGLSALVIIEANSAEEANDRAKDIGIYFNGCLFGVDCECCGDRWDPADEDDGYDAPSYYGEPVEAGMDIWGYPAYIHPLSGGFYKA